MTNEERVQRVADAITAHAEDIYWSCETGSSDDCQAAIIDCAKAAIAAVLETLDTTHEIYSLKDDNTILRNKLNRAANHLLTKHACDPQCISR